MFNGIYANRKVLVTGHTGFKGSWLSQWLIELGAKVYGFAQDPQPHETLFMKLRLSEYLDSDYRGDVRNLNELVEYVENVQPDFIFHLAAQPLVRLSFQAPVDTFHTNVMGVVNLLEAARSLKNLCSLVVVTTDKCYENREWSFAYRETDAMGGHDPYSASKGCAELIVNSYRNSFFSDSSVYIASARAGNVIGGGDWAIDRIVPDIFRSHFSGQSIGVRNPRATRPWQHVLEPLAGYLWLAAKIYSCSETSRARLCGGFNFGPGPSGNRTVSELVSLIAQQLGGEWHDESDPKAFHEATLLNLAIDKAFHYLGWQPVWNFETTLKKTASWYIADNDLRDMHEKTVQQIHDYESSAFSQQLPWACPVICT